MTTVNKSKKRRGAQNKQDTSQESTKKKPSSKSTKSSRSRPRRSSINIKDRLWEKEQLQDINLRFDYVLNNFNIKNNDNKTPEEFAELQRRFNVRIEELVNQHEKEMNAKDSIISEKNKAIDDLTSKNKDLKSQLQAIKKRNSDLEIEIESIKRAKRALENRANTLKNELDSLKKKYNSQVPYLRDQIAKLELEKQKYEKLLNELKDDFDRKLVKAIEDNKRDFRKQLEKQLNDRFKHQEEEIEERHQEKIDELNKIINNLKSRILGLENKNKSKEEDIQRLRKEISDLEVQLRTLNETIQRLEDDKKTLKNENSEISQAKDNLQNKFDRLKESNDRLAHDYFLALDIKVGLEREIKELEDKLDKFERKYDIQTPYSSGNKTSRKRPSPLGKSIEPSSKRVKLDDANDPGVSFKSVKDDNIDENNFPLLVRKTMFEGNWIGFEVENQYGRPIIPIGWFFSNKDGSQKIPITQKKYGKKDIIRVVFKGKIDKNWSKNITPIQWQYNFKNEKGDIDLYVRDSDGNSQLIANLKAKSRKNIQDQNCYVM